MTLEHSKEQKKKLKIKKDFVMQKRKVYGDNITIPQKMSLEEELSKINEEEILVANERPSCDVIIKQLMEFCEEKKYSFDVLYYFFFFFYYFIFIILFLFLILFLSKKVLESLKKNSEFVQERLYDIDYLRRNIHSGPSNKNEIENKKISSPKMSDKFETEKLRKLLDEKELEIKKLKQIISQYQKNEKN